MQEALHRLPGMHAPAPPGRGTRGSDQGAADADGKLQRPPDGHVRNHRQVPSVPPFVFQDTSEFINANVNQRSVN